MNFFGFTSQLLFAFCVLPEVVTTVKGRVCALSSGYLILWLLAEIFGIVYALGESNYYLLCNYVFNLLCLIILMFYKFQSNGSQNN